MSWVLHGFTDELVKLAVADPASAERSGTGISPPKPPKPIGALTAIKPPSFKPPPGLAPPKVKQPPRMTPQMPRKQGLPKAWTRPSVKMAARAKPQVSKKSELPKPMKVRKGSYFEVPTIKAPKKPKKIKIRRKALTAS
jgi:hypothetical protein